MSLFRRTISLLLTFVMLFGVFSVLPYSALAQTFGTRDVFVKGISNTSEPVRCRVPDKASDGDVTVTGNSERLYSFDENTGTLTLVSGEYDRDNNWKDAISPADIVSITAESGVKFVGDCSDLFILHTNCTNMDLSAVDTSLVTNMNSMFFGCYSLETLDLSGWDTSNVESLTLAFSYCKALEAIDLSGLDFSSVKDMSSAFSYCFSLKEIDLSCLDLSAVEDMSNMFERCDSLTSIDFSGLDTPNLSSTLSMFLDCGGLETVTLSGWNTPDLVDMACMFQGCSKLRTLNMANLDTSDVYGMYYMFAYCASLTTIDMTGIDISSVDDMSYMFSGCYSLTSIDMSGMNAQSVGNVEEMFSGCTSLETVLLPSFGEVPANLLFMFSDCESLKELDMSGIDIWGTCAYGMFSGCDSLKRITVSAVTEITDEMLLSNDHDWVVEGDMTNTVISGDGHTAIIPAQGRVTTYVWVDYNPPIRITQQPQDAETEMGETAVTSVTAEGEGLTYQWYGRDVGQTDFWLSSIKTDTYSVRLVKGKSSRQVYCVITDAYGYSVTTRTATLSAKAPDGYTFGITKQPESAYVYPGEIVNVNLKAEGEGLKYTWYLCDEGSDVFTLSGIKTDTYSTTMNEYRNGRRIYCVVTDKNGYTEQSDTVTIGYNYPEGYTAPVITVQPEDVYVDVNETAVTSFTAEGFDLTYQWYIKEAGSDVWTKSSLKTNTYHVVMIPSKSGRQVQCVVTDKFGAQAETDIVTLGMLLPDGYTEPVITVQPEDVCVTVGETAVTSFTADGYDLTYQWYIKEVGSDVWTRSSLKTNTYSVRMVPSKSGRQVKCVVTDKYGAQAETHIATLTMEAPEGYTVPIIVTQPTDVYVNEGETAVTSFKAEGLDLTYQWYIKEKGSNVWTKSSLKTDTYYVTMIPSKSGRQVKCIVTDRYGMTAETSVVTLNMNPPDGYTGPVILAQPEDCTVSYGGMATSTVIAEGYRLTYQWYGINPDGTVFKSSLCGNIYYVTMVPEKSGRRVYCIITDMFGFTVTTRIATLRMEDDLNQTV